MAISQHDRIAVFHTETDRAENWEIDAETPHIPTKGENDRPNKTNRSLNNTTKRNNHL